MHSLGIVHRDIKLENIMMTDDSESSKPKLVDFGLAKMVGPEEAITELFGTLGYVAPEILQRKSYNKGVDVWSLGVIMYALLSGYMPFDSKDKKEIARQTVEDPVSFNITKFDAVSKEAKQLIVALLHKEKRKRVSIEEALMFPWMLKQSIPD